MTNELIDFEDLAPTLISLGGGSLPDYLKGRVLMGKNRSKPVGHLILSSDRSDNGIDMIRSVTDGRYLYSRNYLPYMPQARYIRYMEIGDIKQQMRQDLADNKLTHLQASLFAPRPSEFLYDIENDVWETQNLIDAPKHAAKAQQMRKQLVAGVMKSRDILFLPEYEIAQISESIPPYTFRLDDRQYPLKEIFAAASLSGQRSTEVAKKQVQLLKSPNKIIRYWAAIGLRSQEKATLIPLKSELGIASEDAYPPVAVIASALLYDTFQDSAAEQALKGFCADDNMEIALMAVNELLYISRKMPFAETIQSRHKSLKNTESGALSTTYKVKAACMDFLGSIGLVPNNFEYRE